MSEHHQEHHSTPEEGHDSLIKTPKQLIIAVLAGLIVPILGIVLLIQFVVNGKPQTPQTASAVVERIAPIANEGFTFKDVNEVRQLQSGEAVYAAACLACHDSGAAGAPKLGDKGTWAPRIAQGFDKLTEHAIKGLRGMPAKGGNPDLDDIEVARAVAYMANKAGASFKEPEAKAPASASASAPNTASTSK